MDPTKIPYYGATALVLFLAIGLHEYAHCKFADMAGDPTPSYYGRVTLNLTKHFEMTGVVMMIFTTLSGFGLGWGKAAPCNPAKMKNPRVDFFISVAAGPLSNLVQAIVYAIVYRLVITTPFMDHVSQDATYQFVFWWIYLGVLINIALAVFNLIPFGPLDGHWLIGLLMPEKQRHYWFKFNRQIGMPGLFLAVLVLQIYRIPLTDGPVSWLFHVLTGQNIPV